MNDLLLIILLAIVEGITEFLPVSSTAHMAIGGALLHFDADRWDVFLIVIQLGAIMAIVVLYWRTFWAVLQGLFRGDAASFRFVRNLLVAFMPAAVLGIILHKKIEALLHSPIIMCIALIVGGFAILGVEKVAKPKHTHGVSDLPLGTVLGIGILQCLAMIPGISRSGATIMGALALGVDRRTAAEFSFFLAIPTMFGASAVQLFSHRHELASGGQVGLGAIALGSAIAFVVALVVVRWFVGIVSRRGFAPFAWYRIVAGGAALAWLLTAAR
jgi:undecaprenyl-diphosphatase